MDGWPNPARLTPEIWRRSFALTIMKQPLVRYHRSAQREAILQLVKASESHLTAEEVFARLKQGNPRLSVGTVYRNLHVLAAQGAIRELHFGRGSDVYDGRIDPHYHLVCRGCGDISDLNGVKVTELETEARKHSGVFKVESHSVEFHGLCGWCARAKD